MDIRERDDRLKKVANLREQGINPYPATARRDNSISEVLTQFYEGQKFFVAGRIRTIREHGNISFANLDDGSANMQIVLSKKEMKADKYKLFVKMIEMGDFISVDGDCFVTHKGENSLLVKDFSLLTKAIRPLPEKFHGLKDEEDRLRKRYLDIMFNPEVREMVIKRAKFWQATREFLMKKGFLEVETPVLEALAGGADARPFVTHHNALDLDVFLRISTGELWQKKLMVAGFDKTFEIGRQFRNEGMDAEHLQDYTQMEFYYGYANYKQGMELVKELYRHIASEAFETLKFNIKGFEVDLSKDWIEYDYRSTVLEKTGVDITTATEEEIKAKLDELKVEYDRKGFNITRAIDNLWKYCRKQLAGPGFLVGTPITVSPLAKRDTENTDVAQRFQVILAGSEVGNGYSELNDPVDQAGRFEEQQKLRDDGDDEAQMKDDEFVEALEYGMPPTCGFGFSERLFSFLMDKPARECQIFPLMKPRNDNDNNIIEE